jgi:hypothetical protein
MRSSTKDHPAATYGEICSRIIPIMLLRASSRSPSGIASICLRKMMLTAPSGPMTEISAVGHPTMRSGSYARPFIT